MVVIFVKSVWHALLSFFRNQVHFFSIYDYNLDNLYLYINVTLISSRL